jgi:hypothetical protein
MAFSMPNGIVNRPTIANAVPPKRPIAVCMPCKGGLVVRYANVQYVAEALRALFKIDATLSREYDTDSVTVASSAQ